MGKKNVRTLEHGGRCYVWVPISFSWTNLRVWIGLWTPWLKWIPSLLMNTKVKGSLSQNDYCTVKYHKCDTLCAAETTNLSFLLIYTLSVSSWVRLSLWNVRVSHYNLSLIQFICFIQESGFMIHRNKVFNSSI